MLILVVTVLGLFVGTGLTVLIDRIPGEESFDQPASSLVPSGVDAQWWHLLPLVGSGGLLGARRSAEAEAESTAADPVAVPVMAGRGLLGPDPLDHSDSEHVPAGPPAPGVRLLVELTTAAVFGAMAWRIGLRPALGVYLLGSASLVALSVIDLQHYRLPNRLVFPTLGLVVVGVGLVSGLSGDLGAASIAYLGGLAYFAILMVCHLISPRGMGMGDVKLAAVLGVLLAWIAPALVLLGLLISCLIGSIAGGVVFAIRRRNSGFPFGPALAAGTLVAIWAHPWLLSNLG